MKRKQFKTCFCLFCINFFIFLPLVIIYLLPTFFLISFLEDPFFLEIFRIGLEISIGCLKHYVIFSLLCVFYYSLFSWFLLCLLSFFKNEICWRLILLVYKKLLYLSVLFTVYKTKSDVNVFYHTFVGLCSPFFFFNHYDFWSFVNLFVLLHLSLWIFFWNYYFKCFIFFFGPGVIEKHFFVCLYSCIDLYIIFLLHKWNYAIFTFFHFQ